MLLVGWYLRLTLCEVSNPDYFDVENILYLGLSPLLYRRKGINRCLVPIFFSDAMEYEKCVSGLDKWIRIRIGWFFIPCSSNRNGRVSGLETEWSWQWWESSVSVEGRRQQRGQE